MHVKTHPSDVAVLFSFLQTRFTPAVSIPFFTPRSRPRSKSLLPRGRLLATSAHLSISMPIALISLMQMSLKGISARLLILLSMTNSPCRKTARVLPLIDCYLQYRLAELRRRSCHNDVEYILWTPAPDLSSGLNPEVIPLIRYGHKSVLLDGLHSRADEFYSNIQI